MIAARPFRSSGPVQNSMKDSGSVRHHEAASATARKGRGDGDGQTAAKSTPEQNPIAMLQEQLTQQDHKLAEQDLKLNSLDADMKRLLAMVSALGK